MSVVESVVAIDGQSRYPGSRGKFMPKGPRIESDDDDLGKESSKSSGGKESKASKKKSEAQTKKEEQARRIANLEKEKEESQQTTQEQSKKAQEVVDQLKKAGLWQEGAIDREAADRQFDEQLEASKKAHAGVGEPDVVLETNVGSNPVGIYKSEKGYVLTGLPDAKYNAEILRELFSQANIEGKKFPKDFDEWSLPERQSFVAENFGVRGANYGDLQNILPAGMGPDPIDTLNPAMVGGAISSYITEMKRESAKAFNNQRYETFQKIDESLTEAVASGAVTITPAQEADLKDVRDLLAERMSLLRGQARTAQEKEQGYLDFNEYFGRDYQGVKTDIEAGTIATATHLKTTLESVRDWADNGGAGGVDRGFLRTTHITDPEDEAQWADATPGVPTSVNKQTIRKFFEVTRALSQEVELNGRDRVQALLVNQAGMPADQARELLELFVSTERGVNLKIRVNSFFQNIYKNIGEKRQDAIAGDIKENAGPASNSIAAGWQEFNPRMKRLFDVVDTDRGLTGKKLALREWRGMLDIEGVEANVRFAKLTQPPEHWEDTPEAIYKLIATVEPSGQSPQDLQQTIGAAYGMLTRIDTSTPYGRGMHFELKEMLEAFKFKQSLIITAHIESLAPEALQRVYKELEGNLESTFTNIIARFEKDSRGRRWFATENGVTEQTNLFDESKRLYSERIREDRIKMNMVEEMTKCSLDGLDIGAIQKAVGYNSLPADWKVRIRTEEEFHKYGLDPAWRDKTKWEVALESTRRWLVKRWADRGYPVDAHGNPDGWAEGKMRHSSTKEVVGDWYQRKTLHGAYGLIDEVGREDLAEELKDVFRKELRPARPGVPAVWETDAQVKNRLKAEVFGEGQTFQQARRAEMRQRLRNRLAEMHLSVDPNVTWGVREGTRSPLKPLGDTELEELLASAYLGAVDSNAYDLTWLFEWSDYHFIHIYGKDAKGPDDYKALVVNQSSDNYFALMIDHNWEFMHEDFEDRGRERPGDVDETFKKHFAGKHHWMFGHVSMGARFIRDFLSDEDNVLVEQRTAKLVKDYDYYRKDGHYKDDFEDFLRGVAKRELIAEGAISFADSKYSKVVAERKALNKFNPIDNAADRNLVMKFMGPGAIQAYLANPEGKKFEKMTTKEDGFMSTRNPRLFPWIEFGLRAHWDVVHHLKYKMFGEPDITKREMKNFVENLAAGGHIETEQADKFIEGEVHWGKLPLFGPVGNFFTDIYEEEKRYNQTQKRGLLLMMLSIIWAVVTSSVTGFGKGAFEELKKDQK